MAAPDIAALRRPASTQREDDAWRRCGGLGRGPARPGSEMPCSRDPQVAGVGRWSISTLHDTAGHRRQI